MGSIDTTCRLCGRVNNKLISVLDYDEDEQSAEPNLLQKIRYCLPVEVCIYVCVYDERLYSPKHFIYPIEELINSVISQYRSVHSMHSQRKSVNRAAIERIPCTSSSKPF